MAVVFFCTQCGVRLRVPDALGGGHVGCPRCGTAVRTPSPADALPQAQLADAYVAELDYADADFADRHFADPNVGDAHAPHADRADADHAGADRASPADDGTLGLDVVERIPFASTVSPAAAADPPSPYVVEVDDVPDDAGDAVPFEDVPAADPDAWRPPVADDPSTLHYARRQPLGLSGDALAAMADRLARVTHGDPAASTLMTHCPHCGSTIASFIGRCPFCRHPLKGR